MNKREWPTCNDPVSMLHFLRDKVSERKLRLFAAACCRQFCGYGLNKHKIGRRAVEVAERVADGMLGEQDLAAARDALSRIREQVGFFGALEEEAAEVALDVVDADAWRGACESATSVMYNRVPEELDDLHEAPAEDLAEDLPSAEETPEFLEAAAAIADLIREIIGDPFRPVVVSPPLRTAAVLALAAAAYDNRELPAGIFEPERLDILADALEDAGCNNASILGHLREPGPHARGCWAVDLLLGKE